MGERGVRAEGRRCRFRRRTLPQKVIKILKVLDIHSGDDHGTGKSRAYEKEWVEEFG